MKRGVAVPANPMGVEAYGLGLTKLRLACGAVLYGNMGGLSGYDTWMLSDAAGSRPIAIAATTEEVPPVDRAIHRVVDVGPGGPLHCRFGRAYPFLAVTQDLFDQKSASKWTKRLLDTRRSTG